VVVNRRRTEPGGGEGGRSASGAGVPGQVWFVLAIVLVVLGGAIFLALWNPPVPRAPVEKVVPNAHFTK
jgi:hypothetical protein